MANRIQKLIYNLSALSPLLLVISVAWYLEKRSWIVPIICCSIAIVLAACTLVLFFYGKKNFPTIEIRTSKISPNDGWIFLYIISYIVPLVPVFVDSQSILIIGIIAGVVSTVLFACVIDAIPNPILFLIGYHFYKVEAENGVSDYVLVSKRKLRNKHGLTTVKRVFDYLLIDTEV